METVISFFGHPFFSIVGGITVIILVAGLSIKTIFWIFNISPIIIRLGVALWKRRVAIFGSGESFDFLERSLIDSKIFRKKNIVYIDKKNIEKAKAETIFLVDWDIFGDEIEAVFSARKNHQVPIIIYAKPQIIPKEKMNDIANRPNTVVVNFRGRLLNDILTSLITTSYDK